MFPGRRLGGVLPKLDGKSMIVILAAMLTPLVFHGSYVFAWQFAAVGDIDCNDTGKMVAEGMKATDAFIHILLGDIGYGQEECVFEYFQEQGVNVLAACGNHDECGELEKLSGHPSTFGFVHENVAFQIVNTESSISSQEKQLQADFKKWQADPNIGTIEVAQHKPAVTNPSAHHPESEIEGFRDFYVVMKEKYPKFTLLLQGHNHGYQVCKPDSPSITVVTDGTGGRDPYPWGSSTDDNCDSQLTGSKYDGFSLFEVIGSEISGKHLNAN
ncbi:MAG TPA: hypothetical protein VH415_17220 [Nitrososphaeraceae archaeon]